MFRLTIHDQDDIDWKEKKKEELKKGAKGLIKIGELIGKKGKDLVSIPLPQIEIPTFKHGKNRNGVGQGEGEVGDPLASGDPKNSGQGAGELPGEHILEVEIELEEIINALEWELPNLKPKGKQNITEKKEKYNTIRKTGPRGLTHKKRTFLTALKREITSNEYDFLNPVIIPQKDDLKIKSWKNILEPTAEALIIHLMDVSGSMEDEQKEIARLIGFWIETLARKKYEHIKIIYIIHDAVARQTDGETFYHTRESGGTKISSVYKETANLLDPKKGSVLGTNRISYSPEEINIYVFQFTDGDNWGGEDTKTCMEILEKDILPNINLFGYFQTTSAYGTGEFKNDLEIHFKNSSFKNLKTAEVNGKDAIFESITKILNLKT